MKSFHTNRLVRIVLVNNAGRMNAEAKPHESACEDWWKTFEVSHPNVCVIDGLKTTLYCQVNVKGTYTVSREAIRRALSVSSRPNLVSITLVASTTKEIYRAVQTIINTSSVAAGNTRLGFSSYGSSKSAINRFTEFLHFEYEYQGIRVFAYHPGSSHHTFSASGSHLLTDMYIITCRSHNDHPRTRLHAGQHVCHTDRQT